MHNFVGLRRSAGWRFGRTWKSRGRADDTSDRQLSEPVKHLRKTSAVITFHFFQTLCFFSAALEEQFRWSFFAVELFFIYWCSTDVELEPAFLFFFFIEASTIDLTLNSLEEVAALFTAVVLSVMQEKQCSCKTKSAKPKLCKSSVRVSRCRAPIIQSRIRARYAATWRQHSDWG